MSEIDKEKEDYVPFDELDVEFGDFIGHFKNCIRGESLQHFFNVWEHAEEAGHTYGRDTGKIEKADNWDGKSRVSNDTYRKRWHEIFGKKENDELAESNKQSIANKQEREDNEAYLKEIKDKL